MNKTINWTNWQQLRGVRVWEACLLSVDCNPSTIVHELQAGFYIPSSASSQIFNASFPGNKLQKEYHRRLRLVRGYLDQVNTFDLVSKVEPNENLWEIHLSEFAAWANSLSLDIPLELSRIAAAPTPASPVAASPDLPQAIAEKQLGTRERENLLRLVVGMAIRAYNYEPDSAKNSAIQDIHTDLDYLGIALSDDTIRKYLRAGAALLEGRKPA